MNDEVRPSAMVLITEVRKAFEAEAYTVGMKALFDSTAQQNGYEIWVIRNEDKTRWFKEVPLTTSVKEIHEAIERAKQTFMEIAA